jgi:glycosyltransferase involved in cell wall biosynthesis
MRILVFCPTYGAVGGIEAKATHLLQGFRERSHEVGVIAYGMQSAWAREGDVAVYRAPLELLPRRARHVARQLRYWRRLPVAVRRLRSVVRRWDADVVLSLAVTPYVPYPAGLARVVPVVLGLESGGPRFLSHPRMLGRALRRAAHVVACARSLADTVIRLDPTVAPRMSVIPNGVDIECFGEGPVYSHPRPYALAVARLAREKGIDILLDAMAALEGDAAALDLLIAGDGPERAALEAQAARLHLGGRVNFLGACDRTQVASLYRRAVLVACPSRWEGLPLVSLEAMASGCPVVAAAVDGVPDAVLHEETGLLVPPEDPAALARAITLLGGDATRRAAYGARARAVAAERFAWPSVIERHLAILAAWNGGS